GASLARINTKTGDTTIVPFPDKTMQPYHIAVDNNHNVWGNLWTSDQIVKFDPASNKWTTFELPVRGTEIRHISLADIGGKSYVVVPVYRSSQMAKMTVRSEGELRDLKAKAQSQTPPRGAAPDERRPHRKSRGRVGAPDGAGPPADFVVYRTRPSDQQAAMASAPGPAPPARRPAIHPGALPLNRSR